MIVPVACARFSEMRRDRDALDVASRTRQNKALADLDTVNHGERQEF